MKILKLFFVGYKYQQGEKDKGQKTRYVKQQQSYISIRKVHNFPFSAENNENQIEKNIPITPNINTSQLTLSKPPVNAGRTSEAKNTAEKLVQIAEIALYNEKLQN